MIKLENHITVGQILRWKKMGADIIWTGDAFIVTTYNPKIEQLIKEANK